ncbi:unnamed protein product [Dracunculus medinensis]|uniref:NR LBD domain-containing protein n=1 Tax=Dracunculus medinensis TaxID=318479 RepID=A0A0N4U1A6_DRAME|nr:unnamed protein product [Dracunculus medinensis]
MIQDLMESLSSLCSPRPELYAAWTIRMIKGKEASKIDVKDLTKFVCCILSILDEARNFRASSSHRQFLPSVERIVNYVKKIDPVECLLTLPVEVVKQLFDIAHNLSSLD